MSKNIMHYSELREKMKAKGRKKVFTKLDVQIIMKAKRTGDWSEAHQTKFYKDHGGAYCEMQQILCDIDGVTGL